MVWMQRPSWTSFARGEVCFLQFHFHCNGGQNWFIWFAHLYHWRASMFEWLLSVPCTGLLLEVPPTAAWTSIRRYCLRPVTRKDILYSTTKFGNKQCSELSKQFLLLIFLSFPAVKKGPTWDSRTRLRDEREPNNSFLPGGQFALFFAAVLESRFVARVSIYRPLTREVSVHRSPELHGGAGSDRLKLRSKLVRCSSNLILETSGTKYDSCWSWYLSIYLSVCLFVCLSI